MLQNMLAAAETGQPLWLPELRAVFAASEDARPVMLRLSAGQTARDFALRLPRWETAEERDFLCRYLCATIYNLLSTYSGEEIRYFYEEKDEKLRALFDDLPARFNQPGGFGKVVNIAKRLYGGLSFASSPLADYAPLPPTPPTPAPDLAEKLRAVSRASERKNGLGVDIGGTDIKLAASIGGRLLCTVEYDWNPAASPTAEGIVEPVLSLICRMRDRMAAEGARLDAVGVSFPDIVIADRIVGGETPKTKGMRENSALDYETEFAKLRELKTAILSLCPPGTSVRLTNDGHMAAFTAAMELAAGDAPDAVRGGVLAHSLGTDLGTGWLLADGSIPPIPLEMYDLLLDLGSFPAAAFPPEDLRSTRNENSGMPGARRYLGQAAAYRLAWELDPGLLDGFTQTTGALLSIPTAPHDLRKPCLEHLMREAAAGNPAAEEVFRRIGRHLAAVAQEMTWLLGETPPVRFLFGRFVKSRRCFELLREGFGAADSGIALETADEELANTPLMKALAAREDVTVAQFGQAVGAIYFAIMEEGT